MPSQSYIDPRYNVFTVKGRLIQEPKPGLKEKQRKILERYSDQLFFPSCVHGGIKGKSIFTAIQPHFSQTTNLLTNFLKMDISNFFPSITLEKVVKGLQCYRDCFPSQDQSLDTELLNCFFHLPDRKILPTGAPTSVFLSNIAFFPIDNILLSLNSFIYTRYIDDLIFSSNFPLGDLEGVVKKLLAMYGYQVNPQKTRYMSGGDAKLFGLNIQSGELKIGRNLMRRARAAMYNAVVSGDQDTAKGMLIYIKSVNQQQYQKLKNYYQSLL